MEINKREKIKNIFSWVSLGSAILSSLFIITLIIIFLFIEDNPYRWGWFLPYGWFFILVSIIAISSGVYGVWGKTISWKIIVRSCLGLIYGHLCYVVLCPWFVIVLSSS
ncbi:MAG: hypothetical protein U9O59_05250 [Actinomycetota bacterium]|nr:hypothetical protein [Actinomycetota bacterium]